RLTMYAFQALTLVGGIVMMSGKISPSRSNATRFMFLQALPFVLFPFWSTAVPHWLNGQVAHSWHPPAHGTFAPSGAKPILPSIDVQSGAFLSPSKRLDQYAFAEC